MRVQRNPSAGDVAIGATMLACLGVGGYFIWKYYWPQPDDECDTDNDCPYGYVCENGVCVVSPYPPGCNTDDDCPDDFYCNAEGECVLIGTTYSVLNGSVTACGVGHNIAGITVRLNAPGIDLFTVTTDSGMLMENVPPGGYIITYEGDGFHSKSYPLNVPPGVSVDISECLEPIYRFSVVDVGYGAEYHPGDKAQCVFTIRNDSPCVARAYVEAWLGYQAWGTWYDASKRVWLQVEMSAGETITRTIDTVVLSDCPPGPKVGRLYVYQDYSESSEILGHMNKANVTTIVASDLTASIYVDGELLDPDFGSMCAKESRVSINLYNGTDAELDITRLLWGMWDFPTGTVYPNETIALDKFITFPTDWVGGITQLALRMTESSLGDVHIGYWSFEVLPCL